MSEETTTETTVQITTTYEVEGNTLKEINTPAEVQSTITTYNIEEIQAEIAKYQGVIAQWQAKIDPLQAIVDKYNELNTVVEEPVE